MSMKGNRFLLIIFVSVLTAAYSYGVFYAGTQYVGQGLCSFRFAETETTSARYIVREYNNAVAVFEPGSDVPQRVLSIDVSTLRGRDLERFRQGVEVGSLRELAELEEDFSS